MKAVLKTTYNYIVYPLSALLAGITLLIIIQPLGDTFRVFTNSAVKILFGILAFGLICMILKWHRLMFAAFTCTGILCLFLKESSNPAPVYATRLEKEDISIVQLNISNYDGASYFDLTDLLNNSDADLISIQEVTPDWDSVLTQQLIDSFPYFSSVASLGFNGMAVYSKHPLEQLDTFYYQNIPNLTGIFRSKNLNRPVRFISTYTNPTFESSASYEQLRNHFQTVIEKIADTEEARLAFGTYNTVAWSSEMKYFTDELGLQNSRRSINNLFSQSGYEHIFHSKEIECSGLMPLTSKSGNAIGLEATVHFKKTPTIHHVLEPTQ